LSLENDNDTRISPLSSISDFRQRARPPFAILGIPMDSLPDFASFGSHPA
jgi:hypothetical protein